MDTTKMIHVAAEVVLLGGVTFYFNGQIRSLRNEIKDLKAKIEEQQEMTNKHLNNFYAVIDKMNRSPPIQFQHPIPLPRQPQHDTMGIRRRRSPQDEEDVRPTPTTAVKHPIVKRSQPAQKRETQPIYTASEEKDEDVLDGELQEELGELEEQEAQQELEGYNSESGQVEENYSKDSGAAKSQLKDMYAPQQDLSFVQTAIRSSNSSNSSKKK